MRKFEKVSYCPNAKLPERKTSKSAGYDFYALEDSFLTREQVTVVRTGVKCCMEDDEYLQVSLRSGMAIKKGLLLVNGVGIIDADYYNNPDNEGEIMIAIYNPTHSGDDFDEKFQIKAGDRIAQGVFIKYGVTDEDSAKGIRIGGIGSTGVK